MEAGADLWIAEVRRALIGKLPPIRRTGRACGTAVADGRGANVNPMLGISLGLGMDRTEELVAVRQDAWNGDTKEEATAEETLERYGVDAPDGVRVIVASRVDTVDSGCGCGGLTADRLLTGLRAPDASCSATWRRASASWPGWGWAASTSCWS